MSHIVFRNKSPNKEETQSEYFKFKNNSNINREKSRGKSGDISFDKNFFNCKYSNNELLKKSYLSSKSKIDCTSEDILKQLGGSVNNTNQNTNLNTNNISNSNGNNKSLSYANLISSTFSDFQNNFISVNNKNFNLNDDIKDNFGIQLLKNNHDKMNVNKINKHEDKFHDKFNFGEINIAKPFNNINNEKIHNERNLIKLVDKLDFYKLKDRKKSIEENNKKTNLYNFNFKENETYDDTNINFDNQKKMKINIKENNLSFNSFSDLNNNDTSNINKNNNNDDLVEHLNSNILNYKSLGKYINDKDKVMNDKFSKEYESLLKTKQYNKCNDIDNHKINNNNDNNITQNNKFSNRTPYRDYRYKQEEGLDQKKEEDKINLQNELRLKNEEIKILKNNFKKKINLIEEENSKNIEKIEREFYNFIDNMEVNLNTSKIIEEEKERNNNLFLKDIVTKLKTELIDLKSNSINISKHEDYLREIKNKLNEKNIETNFLYSKKIKEIIDYFDKPEYVNLIEKMRFYIKYKEKLDFSKIEFDPKENFGTIREYDYWFDRIKLNLINAETDYLNGMIELENKYNEFYIETAFERNKKLNALENEINTKFNVFLINYII